MSWKAIFLRVRTKEDLDQFKQYFDKLGNDLCFINYLCKTKKRFKKFDKKDVIFAITSEYGDINSAYYEVGIDLRKTAPYWVFLDDLAFEGYTHNGNQCNRFQPFRSDEKTWYEDALKYLGKTLDDIPDESLKPLNEKTSKES